MANGRYAYQLETINKLIYMSGSDVRNSFNPLLQTSYFLTQFTDTANTGYAQTKRVGNAKDALKHHPDANIYIFENVKDYHIDDCQLLTLPKPNFESTS